jgi:hypothetical protein
VNVTVSPKQITEGQSATFTVHASKPVPRDTFVHYTMSGTAKLGSDYNLSGLPGQVEISDGKSTGTVKLLSIKDHVTEGTETATMTLQPGAGYQIGNKRQATVSISDSP